MKGERLRGPAVAMLVVGVLSTAASPASAHETTSFPICASHGKMGKLCEDTYFGLADQHVWIRGKVHAVHEDESAIVLRQRPGSEVWKRIGTVPISEHGKMWFRLSLVRFDIHASEPQRIKLKIIGHGASEDAHMYVARTPAGTAVQAAYSVLGTPYKRFSSDPDYGGLDCSGLTEWAWEQAGVDMPGGAKIQYETFRRVRLSGVVPGDIVYYGGSGPHVALAIGDRRIIHVTGPGYRGRTRIDSMFGYDKPWGAVRVT
jgi:NlpC/P60 family